MDDDDRLVEDLRRIASAVDPVPGHLHEHARIALDWRTIDAELAGLVLDSEDAGGTDGELLLAVRAASGPRLLSFEAGELTIELEVEVQDPATRRLRGLLVPGGPAELEVRHAGGTTRATASADGRFVVSGVPRGPTRLRVTVPGQRDVETPWALL